MAKGASGFLGSAYGAPDPASLRRVYDQWAGTYEQDMARSGYRHPAIVLAMLARWLPAGATPILDAGCGTGLLGPLLEIAGYPEVIGLDLSSSMLAAAQASGAYTDLVQADLSTGLPLPTDKFAGVVSAGVFTTGHVRADALAGLVRVCRPGGLMVLTVKTTLWEAGLAAGLEDMAERGQIDVLGLTEPYLSLPGEEQGVPSLCVAVRVR